MTKNFIDYYGAVPDSTDHADRLKNTIALQAAIKDSASGTVEETTELYVPSGHYFFQLNIPFHLNKANFLLKGDQAKTTIFHGAYGKKDDLEDDDVDLVHFRNVFINVGGSLQIEGISFMGFDTVLHYESFVGNISLNIDKILVAKCKRFLASNTPKRIKEEAERDDDDGTVLVSKKPDLMAQELRITNSQFYRIGNSVINWAFDFKNVWICDNIFRDIVTSAIRLGQFEMWGDQIWRDSVIRGNIIDNVVPFDPNKNNNDIHTILIYGTKSQITGNKLSRIRGKNGSGAEYYGIYTKCTNSVISENELTDFRLELFPTLRDIAQDYELPEYSKEEIEEDETWFLRIRTLIETTASDTTLIGIYVKGNSSGHNLDTSLREPELYPDFEYEGTLEPRAWGYGAIVSNNNINFIGHGTAIGCNCDLIHVTGNKITGAYIGIIGGEKKVSDWIYINGNSISKKVDPELHEIILKTGESEGINISAQYLKKLTISNNYVDGFRIGIRKATAPTGFTSYIFISGNTIIGTEEELDGLIVAFSIVNRSEETIELLNISNNKVAKIEYMLYFSADADTTISKFNFTNNNLDGSSYTRDIYFGDTGSIDIKSLTIQGNNSRTFNTRRATTILARIPVKEKDLLHLSAKVLATGLVTEDYYAENVTWHFIGKASAIEEVAENRQSSGDIFGQKLEWLHDVSRKELHLIIPKTAELSRVSFTYDLELLGMD